MAKVYFNEGVDVARDPRIPPQAANIKGLLIVIVGGMLLCGVSFLWLRNQPLVQRYTGGQQQIVVTFTPSPESTDDPTLLPTATLQTTFNANELMATVMAMSTITPSPSATPTQDYCYFLTPSPTPSLTPMALPITPTGPELLLTATRVALDMTPSPTPTSAPPMAWCDRWFLDQQTAREEVTREVESTEEFEAPEWVTPTGGFPTLPPQPAPPTWTPAQVIQPQGSGNIEIREVVITSEPREIVVTQPPIIVTHEIQIIVPVVITATFTPSLTPSATPTFTFTPTFTETPTATLTETPTETATMTPSATFTATWTHTPTWTPTATPTPTETPTEGF